MGNPAIKDVTPQEMTDEATHEDERSGVHEFPSFPPPSMSIYARSPNVASRRKIPYRVIVAVDLSDLSEGLLLEALRIARGRYLPEVHLLTVVRKASWRFRVRGNRAEKPMTQSEIRLRLKQLINRVLDARREQVETLLEKVDTHIAIGDPVAEIVKLADDLLAEMIVVGAGRRRLFRQTMGEKLMMRTDASIVASRPEGFVGHDRTPIIEPVGPVHDERMGQRHTYHVHQRGVDRKGRLFSWEM